MNTHHAKFESPVGPIYISATDKGLSQLSFDRPRARVEKPGLDSPRAKEILHQTIQQLKEYFAGRRQEFDLPYDVEGTEFQKKVWGALRKIPFGRTISYAELAEKIQNKKASRAVGSANGKNPIGIIVPCHRVIAADGSIGGYAGGIKMKQKLLDLEASFSN